MCEGQAATVKIAMSQLRNFSVDQRSRDLKKMSLSAFDRLDLLEVWRTKTGRDDKPASMRCSAAPVTAQGSAGDAAPPWPPRCCATAFSASALRRASTKACSSSFSRVYSAAALRSSSATNPSCRTQEARLLSRGLSAQCTALRFSQCHVVCTRAQVGVLGQGVAGHIWSA